MHGNVLNKEISQRSVVIHSRCGGMFSNELIANLLVSPLMKEFEKLVSIWRSYGKKSSVLFLTHSS